MDEVGALQMTSLDDSSEKRCPTVGIFGLGLIGGSFAKAYAKAGWRVLASDIDPNVMDAARIETIQGTLDDSSLDECDLIILAAYPDACITWLETHADALSKAAKVSRDADPTLHECQAGPLVIDVAGIKETICTRSFAIAQAAHFPFLGTHPMAGTEMSGFAFSRADLFVGAPMVLVPPELDDISRLLLLDRAHDLLLPVGFGSFSVTTPEAHDKVISYTSQLAHVVSNAYVKSPTAQEHHGFSAGSYRDLTRVAHLNASMWSELMIDNADNLAQEISQLMDSLGTYRDALIARDTPRLKALLAEGDRIKRALDDDLEA